MERVYLHGFATGPAIWQWQPAGYAPELDFSDLQAESAWLAGAIQPGTVLIGWSMGGMVALQTAGLSLENVKALVLVSTSPKFISSPDFPYGLPLALLKKIEKKIKQVGVSAFHELVFGNKTVTGLAETSIEQAEKELAELARVDLRELLPEIEVPTLIIHGDRDEICLPEAARYMADNIPGSKLVMLEGVGHAPMVEAPEKLNEALCWINSL